MFSNYFKISCWKIFCFWCTLNLNGNARNKDMNMYVVIQCKRWGIKSTVFIKVFSRCYYYLSELGKCSWDHCPDKYRQ